MTYIDTNDDDIGITFEDLKWMTEDQINANWDEVCKVMTEQGKPNQEDDDA